MAFMTTNPIMGVIIFAMFCVVIRPPNLIKLASAQVTKATYYTQSIRLTKEAWLKWLTTNSNISWVSWDYM
jgi:hypothetical protein